ncbi:MAG: DUF5057 domain-containing protein [Candidatus Zixiibacteriota bacterium]
MKTRLLILVFIIMAIFSLLGQEGYPAGYFYIIWRGDTMCVEPIITDSTTEAEWFEYTSASMHTGYEEAYEAHLFFFYNPHTGNIGMVSQFNIDDGGTRDATAKLWIDGLPSGASVAISDDSGEFNLSRYPQGDWRWWDNTDGCGFFIPRDEWQFSMRFEFGTDCSPACDPLRSFWFLSGADGADKIYLDSVYIDQEDTIIVGHGFLQALPEEDEHAGDSVLIGDIERYSVTLCNSDETVDTLNVGYTTHSNTSEFILVDTPGRLGPGDCEDFVVDFMPMETGTFYDTITFITNNPCDSVRRIILERKGVEPSITGEFYEETDCDGQNIVEICYTLGGVASVPYQDLYLNLSSDGGDTWEVPFETVTDVEGDIGPSVNTGDHCVSWHASEDFPGYEGCDFMINISGQLPGLAHLTRTTQEDFESGEFTNMEILTPDPDGEDDGALWLVEGHDTIYILQVYPDGHCTDCMSNAIYEYMADGDPPLNIKIFLIRTSAFNAALTTGDPETMVSARYIDETGTMHTAIDRSMMDYHVIMFGCADSYGGFDLTAASADALRTYAMNGKGLLFTHDTIARGRTWFTSLTDISGLSSRDGSWTTFTSVDRAVPDTLDVLNHPFDIPESFSVRTTHWLGQEVVDGLGLYFGPGGVSGGDTKLYWHNYHNPDYNSFSSFYSYGHIEEAPREWEAKAMLNSIYYSYHGGIGTGIYQADPIAFEGGANLYNVTWSADIPPCGGSINIEIAADTCIGETECWTTWFPVTHETPELAMFDQIKYRVGMSSARECESPVLHWVSIDVFDSTIIEHNIEGCIDTWAPRVSIDCPTDTFIMFDTVHFEWEIEDMFYNNDPCSVYVNYCGETEIFLPEENSIDWPVPTRYCDSTWVNIRVAARDSFCNWGFDECSAYCMPIWWVYPRIEAPVTCPGETSLVAVMVDSIEYGWINTIQMELQFDPTIARPINIETEGTFTAGWTIDDVSPSPEDGTIDFTVRSPVAIDAGEGGTIVYIKCYVPEDARAGSYAPIRFVDATFNSGNPDYVATDGIFAVCVEPESWLGTLRLNKAIDPDTEKDLVLAIGADPAATGHYDAGTDLIILPVTPGVVDAYIDYPYEDGTHIRGLRRDIRPNETPQTWIIPTFGESDGKVRWNPDRLPDGNFTINGIDMKADSFTYFGLDDTLVVVWDIPDMMVNEMTFSPGWNLVSLPVVPVPYSGSEIFEFSPVEPFGYNTEERIYYAAEELTAGTGYWVFMTHDTIVQIAGLPVESVNVNLSRGWNIIGATSEERDVSETCTSPSEITIGDIYGYDGSAYTPASSFVPGEGYWLLASEDAIYSNPSGGLYCKLYPVMEDIDYAKIFVDGMPLEFGQTGFAETGLDRYDKAYPPALPDQARDMASFRRDGFELIRDISADNYWNLYLPQDAEISVELPKNYGSCFIDDEYIASDEIYHLRSGYHKVAISDIIPRSNTITGIYPNPFNSSVTIELSDGSNAEFIEVYDVMGSHITTLEISDNSANWNGENSNGIPVQSGIYLFALEGTQSSETQRVILIK